MLTTDIAGNSWETVSNAIIVTKVATRKISINTKVQTYLQTSGNLPIIYNIVAEKNGTVIADEMLQCTMSAAGEKTTDFNIKVENGAKITIECQYMGVGYELASSNPQTINVGDATTYNVEFIYNYAK